MTTPAVLEVFAPITKRERDPKTGHLYVYGKITGSDLDHDQQRMDPSWLKSAVPDWFKIGNLREQHDPKRAVGKAVQLEEKADGWYIGAKVVDREAAEKVEEDVLTGFSIGVKGYRLDMSNKADAPNGTVIDGRIIETSLVDSPCLGSATIADHYRLPLAKADAAGDLQPIDDASVEGGDANTKSQTFGLPPEMYDRLPDLVKTAMADLASAGADVSAEAPEPGAVVADGHEMPVVVNVVVKAEDADLAKYSAEEERQALAAGQAMPNAKGEPSYVIKTKADLRKAIRAVGRGNKDHNSIRSHIVKRAKALGLEAMVPDNWNADGSLKTAEKAQALLEDLRALLPDLSKADDGEDSGGEESEAADISGAKEAIAIIARLVQSEAEGLASGDMGEACDIGMLLDAVRALKWFIASEASEGVRGDDAMMLADDADLLKAAAKNGGKLAPPFKKKDGAASDEDDAEDGNDGEGSDGEQGDDGKTGAKKKSAAKADAAPAGTELLTKADAEQAIREAVARAMAGDTTSAAEQPQTINKAELEDMVKTLLAEARDADKERIEALSAQVAKQDAELAVIKATPIPGGPVLTRTTAMTGHARDADADGLRGQANALLAKAEQFAANRDLAEGYRERAKILLQQAAA